MNKRKNSNSLKLPFQDVIERGIKKLNEENDVEETIETLIVSIGAPRLRSLGFKIKRNIENPEHKLYDLLSRMYSSGKAHSQYNAIIRRLVSFERSLQCVKKQI